MACAKNTETPFLFTGPRHGYYTGFAKLQNGLEILTAAFNEIKFDSKSNTMIVGGAAVFKDVANALYAVKKNIRESRYFFEACNKCGLYRALLADKK